MSRPALEGRLALVTGGGRGIGRAICLALAEDGADVVVNYRRDEAAARDAVAAIEQRGRRAWSVPGSVADPADAERVAVACSEIGVVDILVHNAGQASRGRSVVDTSLQEIQDVLAVNVLGPHRLTQLLVPAMRARPRGDVVFISSVVTRLLIPYGAPYNLSKCAMEALAATLAKEERDHGIHVNVVAPGLVATEMGRRMVASMGVDDIHALDPLSPFGRVCVPEDVANVVRAIVGRAGDYVTGERIEVSGGVTS